MNRRRRGSIQPLIKPGTRPARHLTPFSAARAIEVRKAEPRGEELWLRTGFVSRGYTYAAGQPHFADIETYRLPSLVAQWNSGAVVVALGLSQSLVGPLG